MKWENQITYWCNKRFIKAKVLYQLCYPTLKTTKREWFKIGETEVVLNKETMTLSCTCKECSINQNQLCEYKIAVLIWRALK